MSLEVDSASTQLTQGAADELRTSPLATSYLVIDGVGYKGGVASESQGRSSPQAEVKEVPDHLLAIQWARSRQWIAQHPASRSIQEFQLHSILCSQGLSEGKGPTSFIVFVCSFGFVCYTVPFWSPGWS